MEHAELVRALGRIEGRLEGIESEQRRISTSIARTDAHIQTRINQLERNESKRTGWAAGAGAAAGAIIAAVAWVIGVFW